MRHTQILVLTALAVLLLAASCVTPSSSTLPTPLSQLDTPATATATATPTLTTTEVSHTPTATEIRSELLLPGEIGFVAYDVLSGECEGAPSGDGFYYFNLYTANANGLDLRRQGEFETHFQTISWSPNGHWTLLHAVMGSPPLSSPHTLYLIDNRSEKTITIELSHTKDFNMHMITYQNETIPPIWSPKSDKAAINLILTSTSGSKRDIYMLDTESHQLTPLVATPSEEAILSWSPDGEWIAYAQWEGYDLEPQRLRLMVSRSDGSAPREVICCGIFPIDFHWSADNLQLIFPIFDGETLIQISVNIERDQPFDTVQLPSDTPKLYPSPSGKYYAMVLEINNQTDIFTINTTSNELTNLTHHPADDDLPHWSPDSNYIAFTSNRGEVPWLRLLNVIKVDGSQIHLISNKCVGPFSWWPFPRENGE